MVQLVHGGQTNPGIFAERKEGGGGRGNGSEDRLLLRVGNKAAVDRETCEARHRKTGICLKLICFNCPFKKGQVVSRHNRANSNVRTRSKQPFSKSPPIRQISRGCWCVRYLTARSETFRRGHARQGGSSAGRKPSHALWSVQEYSEENKRPGLRIKPSRPWGLLLTQPIRHQGIYCRGLCCSGSTGCAWTSPDARRNYAWRQKRSRERNMMYTWAVQVWTARANIFVWVVLVIHVWEFSLNRSAGC